jgi:16S rRNA processing protein RimM
VTPEPEPQRPVAVGRITRAHGTHGEVGVLVLSEVSERFAPGSVLYLEDGRALTVEEGRPHGARLLVKFLEVGDRTEAELLRGRYLVVPPSLIPEPPQGAYWPHQLEGCEVVTEEGRSLGRIREVIQAPASDLWVTRAEDGAEVLVPALKHVVVSVDLAGRRVVVRSVPGLLPDED